MTIPSARSAAVLATLCVLAACRAQPAQAPIGPEIPASAIDDDAPRGRLDARARPVRYALELAIDPAAPGFTGTVAVDVAIDRPTRVVWLHARGLSLDRITIAAGGLTQPARPLADPRTDHTEGQAELIGLEVGTRLPPGPAKIEIQFAGRYGERVGLIKTDTQPPFIYSDSEPTDARAILPCFDDPKFKTPWQVALVVPSSLLAVANGPELRRSAIDATHTRIEFAPTRPLPSYLVAIAVGDLVATPVAGGPVPLRIITPPELVDRTAVAAAALPALITSLSQFLDEPLPVAKLDLLAIPERDGASKGMENPGLITLVPSVLLVDPAATGHHAEAARQSVVHAVAHELAHQWFGDLITIDDWGMLWLQEGGASWLGAHAARALLGPTWTPPFELAQLDRTLVDGARAPIAMTIRAAADVNAMFRIETYAGGSAIFEALDAWFGAARLRDGLRALVDARRDAHYDLAALLGAVGAGVPAARTAALAPAIVAMTAATRMPLVTVVARCAPTGVSLEITVDDPAPLAVCADLDGADRACAVVRGTATIPTAARACPRWILPNPGGGAPYRRAWPAGALAAVLAVRHSPADELALTSELRERLIFDRAAPPLGVVDRVAANAFLAATSVGSPMVGDGAVAELDALWRAAPDEPARRRLVATIARAIDGRPVVFVDDDRDAATAPLAHWLAIHGDVTMQAAARAAVPDLVATVSSGDASVSYALRARGAIGSAHEFDALRARVLGPKPPWNASSALGSFQLGDIVARLRGLLASPKLSPSAAMTLLVAAAQNPLASPQLVELARVRHDLWPNDRARLAAMTCDPSAAEPLLVGVVATDGGGRHDDPAAAARAAIQRCLATRASWPTATGL